MKYLSISIIACFMLLSCGSPKNFTILYDGEDTGLSNRIDIDGYYVSQYECDSSFYSMYMFYPDGLFLIATTSQIPLDLINCFRGENETSICKYPQWGTYTIKGDTIKTQTIRTEGNGYIIFRDYLILPSNKQITNISDYVEPQYTNLAYMKNYPSFSENRCSQTAQFYPLEKKRSPQTCPFLEKKWFRAKK